MGCVSFDGRWSASAQRSVTCVLRAALFGILVFVAALFAGAPAAFATYADYDTEHPAAQDVGAYGEEIMAADIPDGVYEVEARTDSYMCIFYRSSDDAEAKVEKERCYVQVTNGNMTSVFWISSMYNRLYLGGTAEEAAALTNKAGNDDSHYLKGNPAEGYVPHYYEMAIPALNYPMKFASFAGGQYPVSSDPKSTWFTRAKWYSHVVVFKPTRETLDAIERAKRQEDPGDDPSPGGGQGETPDPDKDPSIVPGTPAAQATPASDESLNAIAAQAVQGSSGGSTSSATGATGATGTTGAMGQGGLRGVKMSAASFNLGEGVGEGNVDIARADEDEEPMVDPVVFLVVALAVLVVAGVGWRVGAFALQKRHRGE